MPALTQRPLPRPVQRVLRSPAFHALTAPHGVSRYLEQLSPAWTLDGNRAVVTEVAHPTRDTTTLTLQPTGDWNGFQAGQYVRLTVEIDGVRHTRCYSLCGSAHAEEHPQVTVKRKPDGLVSRYLNEQVCPGLVVGLSPADGDFVLPEPRPDRLLFISGGSGITPVMSMLRTLLDEGHDGDITFLHYAPTREDVIFRDELSRIDAAHDNVDVVTVMTRESTDDQLTGHLDAGHLDAVAPDLDDTEIYVCGPTSLIEAATVLTAEAGAAERLHVERFTAPVHVPNDADATGTVRFARSGVTADNDGRTILEQAEAAGLSPEHGCRMGICHSCVLTKNCGPVRDLASGRVSTDPDERIQICVTVPAGDVELDL